MNSHDVVSQMLACGMPDPGYLDLSGKIKRYGPKKRAWYSLREVVTKGGTALIVGSFGSWGRIETQKVDIDWKGISAEEREAMRKQQADLARIEQEKRQRKAKMAAMRAGQLWRNASPVGRSAYLDRKLVEAESVRFLPEGEIVVPMIRYDFPRESALVGAQVIDASGAKRFTAGTAKAGSACRLGLVELGAPILVCEGYATGSSIRMAIERRCAVFVAFDAGNLLSVVEIVRTLYPDSPILICADDDWRTEGNPGRAKAKSAAKKVQHSHIVYPIFPGIRGDKETDFNDLHARSGLGEVARQLAAPLNYLRQIKMGRMNERAA